MKEFKPTPNQEFFHLEYKHVLRFLRTNEETHIDQDMKPIQMRVHWFTNVKTGRPVSYVNVEQIVPLDYTEEEKDELNRIAQVCHIHNDYRAYRDLEVKKQFYVEAIIAHW